MAAADQSSAASHGNSTIEKTANPDGSLSVKANNQHDDRRGRTDAAMDEEETQGTGAVHEEVAVLPFYKRKGFAYAMIAVTLVAIGVAVLAVVLPSNNKGRFTTNFELRTAIREYLRQGCPTDADCQARSIYGGAMGDWDVSRVQDFSSLFSFSGARSFNEPLNWDTGSATNMQEMFYYAKAFNQDLSTFNTAAVTDMSYMFHGAAAFNQPLPSFDTSAVTDMNGMFWDAVAFNQPLSTFDTSAVTSMSAMFSGATAFNQPLSTFDTSSVTNMYFMFCLFVHSTSAGLDCPPRRGVQEDR